MPCRCDERRQQLGEAMRAMRAGDRRTAALRIVDVRRSATEDMRALANRAFARSPFARKK